MARERLSVLSSDEVEALSKAFDRAPTPRALQLSLRLKYLIKIGSFASAMIFLSYGEMTPHDTQNVLRDDQMQSEPTWLMLQRFPLAITAEMPWPEPELAMPPLALLAMPIPIVPNKPKAVSQTATIRAGDNPSSADLSRQASAAIKSATASGTIANGSSGTNGTTGSPKPPGITAATNPLTNLVSTFFSGFKQSSPSQNISVSSTNALQSFSGSAIRNAIESARSSNSGFSGSSLGSTSKGSSSFEGSSFSGQSFGGLKKG